MREFETGATRNEDKDQLDYEGFLSPLVLEEFATYMHQHRVQADGELRDADNWQRGIPRDQYLKSLIRHVVMLWGLHRERDTGLDPRLREACCAILFNVQGYLFELLYHR